MFSFASNRTEYEVIKKYIYIFVKSTFKSINFTQNLCDKRKLSFLKNIYITSCALRCPKKSLFKEFFKKKRIDLSF